MKGSEPSSTGNMAVTVGDNTTTLVGGGEGITSAGWVDASLGKTFYAGTGLFNSLHSTFHELYLLQLHFPEA